MVCVVKLQFACVGILQGSFDGFFCKEGSGWQHSVRRLNLGEVPFIMRAPYAHSLPAPLCARVRFFWYHPGLMFPPCFFS
mmetsp:Transcript_28526/g.48489  ORF Transcript_28526/g.48489 Transcript_28526/m.48489 type:complete len:80 (-) Transcript_28526:129-368(-)